LGLHPTRGGLRLLFLTSLLFAVLLYGIPGVLLLLILTKFLHLQFGAIPESIIFLGMAGLLYIALLALVRFTRLHLMQWRDNDSDREFILRQIFDVRQFKWINFLGIAVTAAASLVLILQGALPYAFIPLFAATLLGLLSLSGTATLVPLDPIYPDPRYDDDLYSPPEEDSDSTLSEPPEAVKRNISWSLVRDTGNLAFDHAFELAEESYASATSIPRYPKNQEGYIRYPVEGAIPEIRSLASSLRDLSIQNKLSTIEEVQSIVCMVRQIPYATDMETHNSEDYCNFPVETLYEIAGDCEDHAVLAASLLHSLGHDVALFYLDLGKSGHLALGFQYSKISNGFSMVTTGGKSYSYIETVPRSGPETGIDLGEISDAFLAKLKSAEIWPLPQMSS
jgi:predicted transglutaminase-like cysteine proteinase